eukprot:CAMPEP_0168735062 /NCGR_PEP_ID=MMETSP0724-20121128/9137_1 /TAXON_ID=265536 /ORGANISM="Amphiprora sp., Strain CCMP467" /LENGTH=827 /DNA_ID=CAMNT_0008782189 /DNA_START=171 /DNA_END=2651 /DNA_ORIENTATION=-
MATAQTQLPSDHALRPVESVMVQPHNKNKKYHQTTCKAPGDHRSYHLIDVRGNGNVSITPKHELLANFVQPSQHLGAAASHTIVQADGNVAKVDHSMATRRLPTEILYDKDGLDLFDDITQMESQEYYLTACEENIFQNQMARLIPFIPDGCAIIELGCGSMAKTAIFLDAIRKAGKKDIRFYAIDIEQTSLQASIEDLIAFENKQVDSNCDLFDYYGVLGSYDQALESEILSNLDRPKVALWLGSSIGNWTREGAAEFLNSFSDAVMKPHDLFMIGMDKRNDPLTVARAYNDSAGITREFGLNGLRHLNKLIGAKLFDVDNFEYFAGYNVESGRHEAYFQSKKDQCLTIPEELGSGITTVELKQGELINYEFSVKYSVDDVHELCGRTRFHLCDLLEDSTERYSFGVLTKGAFVPVPRTKMGRARFPELNEFEEVWKIWHKLTSPEIIRDPLEKPITLRHPLLFYVGHIPAFEDIFQSRHFDEPLTEPAFYATIFERGINPVVEDPTKCHAHSEVPDEWPDISEVRAYDAHVHERVRKVYEKFVTPTDGTVDPGMQRLGRQLSIALEHSIMHIETFIYMLVQLKRELLPKTYLPAYLRSESFVCEPLKKALWLDVKPGKVQRGINNMESQDDKSESAVATEFGWDNETPVRDYEVSKPFRAQSRPVTCGEYLDFLMTLDAEDRAHLVPSSWIANNDGSYAMLTLFGPIDVVKCKNCPATLSYKLSEKYRDYLRVQLDDQSIRVPSEEEWVVLQSHLKKSTVHEDIDFMNWMPAQLKDNENHAVGSVWEWTSTVFDSYEGFEQSKMYPGYSADFFDGLHNVVRGASW